MKDKVDHARAELQKALSAVLPETHSERIMEAIDTLTAGWISLGSKAP